MPHISGIIGNSQKSRTTQNDEFEARCVTTQDTKSIPDGIHNDVFEPSFDRDLREAMDFKQARSISTAREFKTWLKGVAARFKDALNSPVEPSERRRKFFGLAREIIAESEMSPTERAKTPAMLKSVDLFLDGP